MIPGQSCQKGRCMQFGRHKWAAATGLSRSLLGWGSGRQTVGSWWVRVGSCSCPAGSSYPWGPASLTYTDPRPLAANPQRTVTKSQEPSKDIYHGPLPSPRFHPTTMMGLTPITPQASLLTPEVLLPWWHPILQGLLRPHSLLGAKTSKHKTRDHQTSWLMWQSTIGQDSSKRPALGYQASYPGLWEPVSSHSIHP